MKDWKTWAIIALAAWCGILTWRDERNLDVAEEMATIGAIQATGSYDNLLYADYKREIDEVRRGGSAKDVSDKSKKEQRERAKKLKEAIERSVNKSNKEQSEMHKADCTTLRSQRRIGTPAPRPKKTQAEIDEDKKYNEERDRYYKAKSRKFEENRLVWWKKQSPQRRKCAIDDLKKEREEYPITFKRRMESLKKDNPELYRLQMEALDGDQAPTQTP